MVSPTEIAHRVRSDIDPHTIEDDRLTAPVMARIGWFAASNIFVSNQKSRIQRVRYFHFSSEMQTGDLNVLPIEP
jgi:hypothetical protein